MKYDHKTLAIGGEEGAIVEELNSADLLWAEHPMSPVNDYSYFRGFSALSIEKSLYIFGKSRLSVPALNDFRVSLGDASR